jgi:hypothetical protein
MICVNLHTKASEERLDNVHSKKSCRAKLEHNFHFFPSDLLHSASAVSCATSVVLSKSKWSVIVIVL